MIIKKKIFFAIFSIIALQLFVKASTTETDIIQATKNIEYISQNIAKEYLYLYSHPQRVQTKIKLENHIKELENSFRFVAKNTNNEDSKNVLDFLSYSKDQIKEILEDEIKAENRESILDQVEALSEGAEAILTSYNYNAQNDKDIKINLANISKLYMAINANINSITNRENIEKEIKKVDSKLINSPVDVKKSWDTLKQLLNSNKEQFIPNIIAMLIRNLEDISKI
jgi:hypothetical protein